MMKKTWIRLIGLLALLAISCGDPGENAPVIEIDFKWPPPCTNGSVSPEIQLKSAPEGTKRFLVKLTDTDLIAYNHGGGYAPYNGKPIIPSGAVEGTYMGPGPPRGTIHDYEIKVTALGENEKVLGVGRKVHRYPPKGEEDVRWSPCG